MSVYSKAWTEFLTAPDKDVFRWVAHLRPGRHKGFSPSDIKPVKREVRKLHRELSILCYGHYRDRSQNKKPNAYLPIISALENRTKAGRLTKVHPHIVLGHHSALNPQVIIDTYVKVAYRVKPEEQRVEYLGSVGERKRLINYVLKFDGSRYECQPAFIYLGTELESEIRHNPDFASRKALPVDDCNKGECKAPSIPSRDARQPCENLSSGNRLY